MQYQMKGLCATISKSFNGENLFNIVSIILLILRYLCNSHLTCKFTNDWECMSKKQT